MPTEPNAPEASRPANWYEEHLARKAELFRERAENARKRAEAAYGTFDGIMGHIPAGQPILIGHHSERRHRRELERADKAIHRFGEEMETARYYERKAESTSNNSAISSRDPEAIEKLREKIAAEEASHADAKAANQAMLAAIRAAKKAGTYEVTPAHHAALVDSLDIPDDLKEALRETVKFFGWMVPKFNLTAYTREIKRLQDRIAVLEKRANEVASDPIVGNGVRVEENTERDSLELYFPGKPSPEVISSLKGNGWRWARSGGCWYKRRSQSARDFAMQFVAHTEDTEDGADSDS